MNETAKVFVAGNSLAVLLPKAFHVNTREVWIKQDEVTGEITLLPKDDGDEGKVERQRDFETLLKMIADDPLPEDHFECSPGLKLDDGVA